MSNYIYGADPYEKEEEYNFIEPKHYQLWEGMQPFELHKKLLTEEEYKGFLKGNILKYQMRMGNKPNEPIERDIEKIKIYREELNKLSK